MFRHNPRGPLGSVAVNKEIKTTLADPAKRDLFQLMNNGLSAVCAAFTDPKVESDTAVVRVKDFQIVNRMSNDIHHLGIIGGEAVSLEMPV